MYSVGPVGPNPMSMGQAPPQPQMGPLMAGPIAPGGPGMGPGPMMDPASNNQPLQFNTNKGNQPMAMPVMSNDGIEHGDKDDRINHTPPDTNNSNMGMMPGPNIGTVGPVNGPNMPSGPWGPVMGPNMMGMDPSMMMNPMAYQQYGYMGPMPPPLDGPIQKEIITLKSYAPPPSTRERPPGCRTVFVGGLPELMTEDAVREIFDNFGVVCSCRMSKKNFAHIRYDMEESVERCLYLSGYRIKMDNKDDKPNTGRIHVDYAQARDDLYEWECQMRAYAREERHRQRVAEAALRPPSPPPIVHFSDHEASVLVEELKNDESFPKAAQVLITWLERGDCNRRTSNTFYSMIQCVNSHIRRLLSEVQLHNEELENVKMQFRTRLEGVLKQFEQIENVFGATSKQKAWDHFSKAQRKNLDTWRKQAKNVTDQQRDAFFKERVEAEMEMSDSEENEVAAKKKRTMDPSEYAHAAMLEWQSTQLKDENDSLKCQLEAYKNEVDLIKQESKNLEDAKDKQVKTLQQALQGMQQQLIQSKQQMKKDEEEISSLKARETTHIGEFEPEKVTVVVVDADAVAEEATKISEEVTNGLADSSAALVSSGIGAHTALPEKEARILALLSTFLHVHPFGASIDYIWSYLQRLDLSVRTGELEDLMERYPTLYRPNIHGVGASIEKRWKFIGFNAGQKSAMLS